MDASDNVVAHYEYSPFGKITYKDGDKKDDFRHRFSTKYRDDETNLYYYGYRYYSNELGRWLNRDPMGEEGGLNVYGFVENAGINAWDMLGLNKRECIKAGGRWVVDESISVVFKNRGVCCCGKNEFNPSTHDCCGAFGGIIISKNSEDYKDIPTIGNPRGRSVPLDELPSGSGMGYMATQALTLGSSLQPDSPVAQAVAQTNADIYNAALLQHGIMSAGKHLAPAIGRAANRLRPGATRLAGHGQRAYRTARSGADHGYRLLSYHQSSLARSARFLGETSTQFGASSAGMASPAARRWAWIAGSGGAAAWENREYIKHGAKTGWEYSKDLFNDIYLENYDW